MSALLQKLIVVLQCSNEQCANETTARTGARRMVGCGGQIKDFDGQEKAGLSTEMQEGNTLQLAAKEKPKPRRRCCLPTEALYTAL